MTFGFPPRMSRIINGPKVYCNFFKVWRHLWKIYFTFAFPPNIGLSTHFSTPSAMESIEFWWGSSLQVIWTPQAFPSFQIFMAQWEPRDFSTISLGTPEISTNQIRVKVNKKHLHIFTYQVVFSSKVKLLLNEQTYDPEIVAAVDRR